jgi:hypothetical protein
MADRPDPVLNSAAAAIARELSTEDAAELVTFLKTETDAALALAEAVEDRLGSAAAKSILGGRGMPGCGSIPSR